MCEPWTMLQAFKFGKWPIAESEVFATSKFAFAFVNLKPLVPGEKHRRYRQASVSTSAFCWFGSSDLRINPSSCIRRPRVGGIAPD
jgi:hypothetical protein